MPATGMQKSAANAPEGAAVHAVQIPSLTISTAYPIDPMTGSSSCRSRRHKSSRDSCAAGSSLLPLSLRQLHALILVGHSEEVLHEAAGRDGVGADFVGHDCGARMVDAGHMQIAWLAWQKLDAQTRLKADALLQTQSGLSEVGLPARLPAAWRNSPSRAPLSGLTISSLSGSGYTRDNATIPAPARTSAMRIRTSMPTGTIAIGAGLPTAHQTIPAEPVDALTQLSHHDPGSKSRLRRIRRRAVL